jgi:hypothetical protein
MEYITGERELNKHRSLDIPELGSGACLYKVPVLYNYCHFVGQCDDLATWEVQKILEPFGRYRYLLKGHCLSLL